MRMSEYAHKKSRWYQTGLPYLLTAVAPLCWGGNIVLARGVADIIPPVSFAFWRWTVAFNLIPVFASILAILFLGERLQVFHLIGMLLIFGGMILFNR